MNKERETKAFQLPQLQRSGRRRGWEVQRDPSYKSNLKRHRRWKENAAIKGGILELCDSALRALKVERKYGNLPNRKSESL